MNDLDSDAHEMRFADNFLSINKWAKRAAFKEWLEAASVSDFYIISSGKCNFCQEEVREFWKVVSMATVS